MPKRTDKEFLLDILEAIRRINLYTKNLDFENFLKKIETQDAVIRNLEIIGEAIKNISSDLKKKHREIPWKVIAGMRDKVIHFYFGVNLDIVWHTARFKLSELENGIKNIIKELNKQ